MIISKYNHNIYKDKDLNDLGLVNLLNKKVYNMVDISSSEIYKNTSSKNIVELVDKIYANGLIQDLNTEEIDEVKQMKVEVRFQGSIEEIKQNHRLNKFLTRIMLADGYKTPKYENLSDGKINEIISKIKPGYGLNIFKAKKLTSIFDEKGVRQKNRLNSVVVGVESEQVMGGLEKLMNEVGFGMKEMSEYVFLHEFSHAIQHLKVNHEPLLSVGNQEEELMGTKTRWMNDLKYLGHTSYSKNVSYSVLAETYADVRAVLMYAQLFPNKADNMLDVLIKWRDTVGKDDLHDTHQGLLKLKEIFPNGLNQELSASKIHKISRNISTLNGLASVELVMRKAHESKIADYDFAEIETKINLLKEVGIFDEKMSNNDFMNELSLFKDEVMGELRISSDSVINYSCSKINVVSGKDYVRDRNGLIIRDSMIESQKIKFELSRAISVGISVSEIEKIQKKLDSYEVESDSWKLFNGVIFHKDKFKKIVKLFFDNCNKNKIDDMMGNLPTYLQKNYEMYTFIESNFMFGFFMDIRNENNDKIDIKLDVIHKGIESSLLVKPMFCLNRDIVKDKLKKTDLRNNQPIKMIIS